MEPGVPLPDPPWECRAGASYPYLFVSRVCGSLPAGARATVVEDWLDDDIIDITDCDDLDPLDKRVPKCRRPLQIRRPRCLITRARACGRAAAVKAWLDDMIEIVDHPELDLLDKRARIDARRWIMSKVAPQRYGDKVIIGGDGSFGGLGGGSVSLSDLSDEQLAALESLASLRLPVEEPEVLVEPDATDTK